MIEHPPCLILFSFKDIYDINFCVCAAVESLVKGYDNARDCKDYILATIKLLCSVIRSIVAMRLNGSNRNALPDLFVMNMIIVLQTSGVEPFPSRKRHFADNLEIRQCKKGTSGSSFNTPKFIDNMYTNVIRVYNEIFNLGT